MKDDKEKKLEKLYSELSVTKRQQGEMAQKKIEMIEKEIEKLTNLRK